MGPSSKLKASLEGKQDRISNLPDNVLTLILSLLPTRCAVATSALSSRWKNLWTTIDSFEFDDVTLRLGTECKDYAEGFLWFVKEVIQRCDAQNIHRFRLGYHGFDNSAFINSCILFVIRRNVQELELNVLNWRDLRFFYEFFTCKSLKKLKIEIDSLFNVPLLNDTFPNLKSLHIQFKFPNSMLCRELLSACPKLEDLVIHAGTQYWDHLQCKDTGRKITVRYLLDNMLIFPEYCFLNLARLEITISDFIVHVVLPVFLRASPDLNVLILRMEHAEKPDARFSKSFNSKWNARFREEEVPSCLLKQLREVKITSYKDGFLERNMIKYLLDCGEVLQKMSIYVHKLGIKVQVSQWISEVPRASKNCQLKVVFETCDSFLRKTTCGFALKPGI